MNTGVLRIEINGIMKKDQLINEQDHIRIVPSLRGGMEERKERK